VSFSVALDTTLSLKLVLASVDALLACKLVISVEAVVKLFLIAVKLSRKPCDELSCPAMGKVPSILPGTIALVIFYVVLLKL
jgi:hypothetical protein